MSSCQIHKKTRVKVHTLLKYLNKYIYLLCIGIEVVVAGETEDWSVSRRAQTGSEGG